MGLMQALQQIQSAPNFAELRQTMVDRQIRTFDVTDRAVIARFLEVPREKFVPVEATDLAYSDLSLKVGPKSATRRLLAPMVLARLIQEARIKPNDAVLDIAPGTGYSTAILAGLAKDTTALEEEPALQAMVKANLAAVGLQSIPAFAGPLTEGVGDKAPFDLIFINGTVEEHLDSLFAQLREGGRLLAFTRDQAIHNQHACRAVLFEKCSDQISKRILFDAPAPILSAFRQTPRFVF